MSDLTNALHIAIDAHTGQVDKAGQPYILHVLRVVLAVAPEGEKAMMVAALHDVIEDNKEWSAERLLAEGFSQEIVEAVLSVTRRDGESYSEFVQRAGANPIGRLVKLADLRDNSDLCRIPNPSANDRQRTEKYHRAIQQLLKN